MAMTEALNSGTGRFITLLRIATVGNTDIIRLAIATRDYTFNSELYKAFPFEISKLQFKSGVEPDNATIQHVLEGTFTRLNLVAGKWSGATVIAYVVDFEHPEWGYARKHTGRMGEVTTGGVGAQTEFRGLMQLLTQDVGWTVSGLCRYQLGDANCTVNVASHTQLHTVALVTDKQKFGISVAVENGLYTKGRLTWVTGLNAGLSMEIALATTTVITLFLPMRNAISIGDTANIIKGDDKTLAMCHTRFSNAVNFGGEDGVPTRDRIFKIPD